MLLCLAGLGLLLISISEPTMTQTHGNPAIHVWKTYQILSPTEDILVKVKDFVSKIGVLAPKWDRKNLHSA